MDFKEIAALCLRILERLDATDGHMSYQWLNRSLVLRIINQKGIINAQFGSVVHGVAFYALIRMVRYSRNFSQRFCQQRSEFLWSFRTLMWTVDPAPNVHLGL